MSKVPSVHTQHTNLHVLVGGPVPKRSSHTSVLHYTYLYYLKVKEALGDSFRFHLLMIHNTPCGLASSSCMSLMMSTVRRLY